MSIRNVSVLAVALLACGAVAAGEQADWTAVEDGDTLVVVVQGQEMRVQLAGIDAPEDVPNPKLKKDVERTGLAEQDLLSLGAESTRYLKQLSATNKMLGLELDKAGKDKYGRMPALVSLADGKTLNTLMLESGYALAIPDRMLDAATTQQWVGLQQHARDTSQGLWAEPWRQHADAWAGLAGAR